MAGRRSTTSALLRPACSQPPLAPHPSPAVSPATLRRFSVLKKVNNWEIGPAVRRVRGSGSDLLQVTLPFQGLHSLWKLGENWGATFQTWKIKGKLGCHFANLKIGENWDATFQIWKIKGKLGCHFADLEIGGNLDATFQIWKVGGKLRCCFPNLAN